MTDQEKPVKPEDLTEADRDYVEGGGLNTHPDYKFPKTEGDETREAMGK